MKLPTISFNKKDYQPAIRFHSFIKKPRDNNSFLPHVAVIVKDRPGQVAYALTQEIRNPLGHINLSVEMLQSIVKDNDLKMYLDVIMRNSIRIENLMHEFLLISHGANAGQAEDISHHTLTHRHS